MSALTPDERRRYDTLRSRITASVKEVTATDSSYRLRMDDAVAVPELAEWMALEHRCCPFLHITLSLLPDDTRWVELGGSGAIKEFLAGEFSKLIR